MDLCKTDFDENTVRVLIFTKINGKDFIKTHEIDKNVFLSVEKDCIGLLVKSSLLDIRTACEKE